MKYLYIDTSSSFLYSAIVEDSNLLASISERMDHDLSKNTLLKISEMFSKLSLEPNDIDKIIVVNGPGSFTGIRIGITIAKVFAWGLNKGITTISSLEAMATSVNTSKFLVPMIDARRGFVYSAIYDSSGRVIMEPQHINLDVLKSKLSNLSDYSVITNDDIDIDANRVVYVPDMLKIVEKYKNRENINPHSVNPCYLKLTEAEEKNSK